ncbi:MAG TPA: lanthionine synthetase LanC family protein [Bryobacteraceae bacterium]|jgi:type 2 lantibiotic biosynthesis protein LanM|nr:lanthionine synthetase LanC family protein [Bryobacteraceae bacterium]
MNPAYIETAERIGARLCRDAVWHQGRTNWTSDFLDGESIAHGALGPALYDGTSGIALFLWRLAEVTGERIFRVTAEAALRQALGKMPVPGCGLYSGGLGILYAATEIRQEFDKTLVLRQAELNRAQLDLIDGSAGAIAVLLNLHARTPSAPLLDAAVRHGDLLLDQAARTEEGWSWKTIPASRNLTGFSHGASGIAWALLELHHATGEHRFREAALQAFRYEQYCFNQAEQNWPDFREEQPSYPVFWCHGAAGIALCRLRAWQILGHANLLTEARAALRTVELHSASLTSFSLCHGRAGNADVLIVASQMLAEESWLRSAEAVADEGLERYERRRIPWPCGLPDANETPDLMLGLAGIGHFYLWLADPVRIRSVLLPGCC